jgi:hypothetical protein
MVLLVGGGLIGLFAGRRPARAAASTTATGADEPDAPERDVTRS